MTGIKEQNPYVGPRPFSLGQRLYGRDRELRELFDLLVARRVVLLHSPSGAGKSSLVQASLVPRLKREGFDVWRTIRLNLDPAALPGAAGNRFVASAQASLEDGVPEPRRRGFAEIAGQSLADYLRGRPRREGAPPNVALVFDQFEEVLTVDPLSVDAKREFFAQLGEALQRGDVWALFALREDYLAALSPYRDLVPTRLANAYRIDLLGREAALEAIARPARDGGRQFPAAALLVDDLRTVRVQQPDGSFAPEKGPYVEPMHLQVVCRRLWQAMPDDDLSIDAEDLELGNVDEALADYYRESVERVAGGSLVQERHIREWFGRRLIAAAGVRAQVLRGEEASGGLANELIERLLDSHLIRAEKRAGATWYELAHDRLVEAVRGDNAAWRRRNLSEVQRRASLWEREDRPPGMLLRDVALADAERWAAENETGLTEVEKRFLSASREAQDAADRERRQNLWIKGLAVVAVIVAIVAAWQWWIAERQQRAAERARRDAERQARIATSGRLANAALLNVSRKLDLASLLALEAGNLTDRFEARHAMLSVVQANPQLLAYFHQQDGATGVWSVAVSPDGKTVAAGSLDGQVRLWDVASRQPAGQLHGHRGPVRSVAFSPDASILASGGFDGTVRLWHPATGQPLGEPLRGHDRSVESVAISPDGSTLASGSADRTVRLWSLPAATPLGEPLAAAGAVSSVAISPDGSKLAAAGDGALRLWDVASRESSDAFVLQHRAPVTGVAFSPDGSKLAATDAGALRLWRVESGDELEHLATVDSWASVAFSPDGYILAAGGNEGDLRLWSWAFVAPVYTHRGSLAGHSERVQTIAFSPDGKTLFTGSDDATVRLWAVAESQPLGVWLPTQDNVRVGSIAFSPDGEILATANNVVELWDVSHRRKLRWRGVGDAVAFSPDGSLLAAGGGDGKVRLWNRQDDSSWQPLDPPFEHGGKVSSVAFSPDGKALASGSDDGTAKLWDVEGREFLGVPLAHGERVLSVAFSPDGQTVASAGWGGVRLWAVSSWHPLLQPLGTGLVLSVAFSPDGKVLAAGGVSQSNETVHLWQVATGKLLGSPLGHGQYVSSVAFSPDGKTLASGSRNGTVLLWDLASWQPIGGPLVRHGDPVASVAFSPDGKTLASAGAEPALWLADVDPESWAARNCRRANRNLTLAEWRQYLGSDVPYRRTCPDLPPGEGVEDSPGAQAR